MNAASSSACAHAGGADAGSMFAGGGHTLFGGLANARSFGNGIWPVVGSKTAVTTVDGATLSMVGSHAASSATARVGAYRLRSMVISLIGR